MPTVSVLIPAFKPAYLDQAIASARKQTFSDLEILIGDDTADGALRPIVEEHCATDLRIKYFHHGFGDRRKNLQTLWDKAEGRYIKWLFDDDLLLPESVTRLLSALQDNPCSPLAFHERVWIDSNNKVVHTPPSLLAEGKTSLLNRHLLVTRMVGGCNNFIGEPSNVMLNRELVGSWEKLQRHAGRDFVYITDVALYLNAAEIGPLTLVGGYFSAFRRHRGQTSAQNSPIHSAGFFEWEILLRAEVDRGNLGRDVVVGAVERLAQLYEGAVRNYPELSPLLRGLEELQPLQRGKASSATFTANIDQAYERVNTRYREWREQRSIPKYCTLCDQAVEAWIPHPALEVFQQLDFLIEVEAAGSALEKYLCPRCRCNDRDRHLWLYMSRTGLLDNIQGKRILHIAPEAALEPRISALRPKTYVVGDLHPRQRHHRRINVEALDFPDGSFDLIICNHVLEHVDLPATTLSELSRCLSPNGHLIAQTPYSPMMISTLELTKAASREFKIRYFGQDDHVRLFGADIVDYFAAVGLQGDLYGHSTLLSDIDPDEYGVNGHEPFFFFAKGQAPPVRLNQTAVG